MRGLAPSSRASGRGFQESLPCCQRSRCDAPQQFWAASRRHTAGQLGLPPCQPMAKKKKGKKRQVAAEARQERAIE